MSTKSHTKNQLARISAKIQQLKKKYPTSSDLYIPTQKQNIITKASLHPDSQQFNSKFLTINKNSQKQPQINQFNPKNPQQHSNQTTQRSSKPQPKFIQDDFNPNDRFHDERKYHQSWNKKSGFNKENMFPFSQDLNYQKPFAEYKEDLKNLKKQILSSLDFENFQLSKQKPQNTPKIINNTFATFAKNQSFNVIANPVFGNCHKFKQNQPYKNEIESTNLNKNKNLTIRIDQEDQIPHMIQQQKTVKQVIKTSNKVITVNDQIKSYDSHLSLEYLNEILKKLHEDFHSHKQQVSYLFQEIRLSSQGFIKQTAKTNLRVQNIEKQIKTKQISQGSESEIKILEIQNQAIAKFSKQIRKQLELITLDINAIKSQIVQKSEESSSIEFSKQMIDTFTCNFKEEVMDQFQFTNKRFENHLKEIEGKFFREIFDMRNDIELMGEKIKREDYFEKTLKNLVPQNASNREIKTEQLLSKIKSQLSRDETVLSLLDQNVQKNLCQQIKTKIQKEINHLQSQISEQVSREISTVNKNLKEFETKMVSYGILIENVEEGLKELSNPQNDQQMEIELINKIKKKIVEEFDLQHKTKFNPLKQSVLNKNCSKTDLNEQKIPRSIDQIESQINQIPICQLVDDRNLVLNQASNVSIFTQQVDQNVCAISVNEQSRKKMFSSQVRIYERHSLSSEKGQPSLLDQLVKNSLVFSALNH